MNNALAPLVNMYINQDPIRLILKNLLITMRKEVLELKNIGRMPTETLEDTSAASDVYKRQYRGYFVSNRKI